MKKVLMVGGDERALRAAPRLEEAGYEVETLGLREGDEKNIGASGLNALLFPYPFAVREGSVPTLTGLGLRAGDALALAARGAIALAGAGLEPYASAANALGAQIVLRRYAEDERFLQANAEISAEAAVWEAMRATSEALMDMAVVVTGYGRFGRATAKRLKALGAEVWVAARREEQRLLAASDGMRAVPLEALPNLAPEAKALLNTIPARVIGEEALRALPATSPVLELASAPYGVDCEAARALGVRVELLPALPARYAPESAARALSDACARLLALP